MGGNDGEADTLVPPSSGPERSERTTGAKIGRYALLDRLGAGAMGVVWSAFDPQLDRRVAIKLVHPALLRAPEAAQRLMREARAMAKVSSRSVVTIHDAGEFEGQLFIAMELVEGTNLGSMLRARTDTTDWRRWMAMMLDAGRGLVAAHKAGVLHRDFKPDNVLVDREGRVCVGDFGLATLGEQPVAPDPRWESSGDEGIDLTSTGALVGTPIYMSPQQLRSETIDARADQFSFCVATWEALYGARPFPAPKMSLAAIPELAETIERGVLPPAPPESRVPPLVRDILARGLSADPDSRWPDMASLVAALERAVRRAPDEKFRERGIWTVEIVALGAAVMLAAGVIAFGRSCGRATRSMTVPQLTPAQPRVAKKLWPVALRTGMTTSADGRYVVLSSDRLQVHDTVTGEEWSTLFAREIGVGEVSHVEVDGSAVRYGMRSQHAIMRWDYRSGGMPVKERDLPGTWFGTLATGELSYAYLAPTPELSLVDASGAALRTWIVADKLDSLEVSPNRRRFAYVHPARFRGRIVVGDLDRDALVSSPELDSPTSVAFVGDDELVYAMGTIGQPQVMRARIADTIVETGTAYSLDAGWFGPMRVHGSHMFIVQMQPAPRTTLVVRSATGTSARDLDKSVSLGWVSPTEFLAWSRTTERIERRTIRQTLDLTAAKLDGEPANGTLSGDALIVNVRRPAGREAIALSRTTGAVLWRHQDGRTLAVRCAADAGPPCFAIRVDPTKDTGAGSDELVSLVPETGELGTTPIYRGAIQDFAVSADGARLVLVGSGSSIVELERTGAVVARREAKMTNIRSIAFDPTGGFLIAGTQTRNTYEVGHMKGDAYAVVAESEDDILSMVRPSPDGSQVLILARVYAPEVWQVSLAK